MARPPRNVVRSVGVGLFLALALLYLLAIPLQFEREAYLGVLQILGMGLTLGGAIGLMVEDRDRIWWYALVEGVLNAAGYLVTRFTGLPLGGRELAGDFLGHRPLTLVFVAVLLSGLAGWTLLDRHSPATHRTVTSARERATGDDDEPRDPP